MQGQSKLLLILFWVLSGTLGLAFGQNPTTKIRVNIPFPFFVAEHRYPAGEYKFSSASDLVMLYQAGLTKAMALTNAVEGRSTASNGQVVFHCHRNVCYLYQVWIPEKDAGRQLMVPPQERDLIRRREPTVYVALLGELERP
jgi:hypothetical protein